jgi:hypothetical protein
MVRLQQKIGMGMADKQSNKVEMVMKWLVVSTPLKNISQLGLWKNKGHVPNHQPVKWAIVHLKNP